MKHTLMFKIKETGDTMGISSKCFNDEKELHVILLDKGKESLGYRELDIEVIQQEEHDNERKYKMNEENRKICDKTRKALSSYVDYVQRKIDAAADGKENGNTEN